MCSALSPDPPWEAGDDELVSSEAGDDELVSGGDSAGIPEIRKSPGDSEILKISSSISQVSVGTEISLV